MERETELEQLRRATLTAGGDQGALNHRLKRENDSLVENLHKEQDKSYKLLRDLH